LEHWADADIRFTQLAVTDEQMERYSIHRRSGKQLDRDRGFGPWALELDAIPPQDLRRLVERAILKHMPKKKYEALMKQEEREEEKLQELIDQMESEMDEEPDEDGEPDAEE
jgi:hypothetical protein